MGDLEAVVARLARRTVESKIGRSCSLAHSEVFECDATGAWIHSTADKFTQYSLYKFLTHSATVVLW